MKKLSIIFVLFIMFFISGFNVLANSDNENSNDSFIGGATAGILLEENSGKILYEKNIHEKKSPASMTKIMTLLLVFEAIENNIISYDTELICDEYSASMGGSQVYLEPNEKITVDEALKCVCIASANDCAVLLSTYIAGSEKEFVNKMNDKALSLGCKNTLFSDATGLSKENHYTSAYDLGLIAKELINKYPKVLEYTSIKEDYIRKDTDNPFWLVNTNKLIGKVEGVNGLKTGYTTFSGYCIALHMKKNNMGLISIVFGYESASKRNAEAYGLLNYGFSNYKLVTAYNKGDIIKIINNPCYKKEVNIILLSDLSYICKVNDVIKHNTSYSYEIIDNSVEGIINLYDENNNLLSNASIKSSEKIVKRNLFEMMMYILNICFF